MTTDFEIEPFLEKPTQPIEPVDDSGLLYVVSHIPYPVRYSTLKLKGYANERIKAIINAEKWFEFQRSYMERVADMKNLTHNAILAHWDGIAESQEIIKKQAERIEELENIVCQMKNILNPLLEENNTTNTIKKDFNDHDTTSTNKAHGADKAKD